VELFFPTTLLAMDSEWQRVCGTQTDSVLLAQH
jgi:hypothetical protein